MRVVVWNANMAVHRKLQAVVDQLQPDIAVIPECAAPKILEGKLPGAPPYRSVTWIGSSPQKGLSVFGFGDFEVHSIQPVDASLEWVDRVAVTGPVRFDLLAVWAMNHRASNYSTDPSTSPQPRAALMRSASRDPNIPLVIAGDFNDNARWDRPGRPGHSATVDACHQAGLVSAYHSFFGEDQGRETSSTLYWRDRKESGPRYHVDYVFLPRSWLPALREVEVAPFRDWVGSGRSDHTPLIIDLDESALSAPE